MKTSIHLRPVNREAARAVAPRPTHWWDNKAVREYVIRLLDPEASRKAEASKAQMEARTT